jgi:hypothetical protein
MLKPWSPSLPLIFQTCGWREKRLISTPAPALSSSTAGGCSWLLAWWPLVRSVFLASCASSKNREHGALRSEQLDRSEEAQGRRGASREPILFQDAKSFPPRDVTHGTVSSRRSAELLRSPFESAATLPFMIPILYHDAAWNHTMASLRLSDASTLPPSSSATLQAMVSPGARSLAHGMKAWRVALPQIPGSFAGHMLQVALQVSFQATGSRLLCRSFAGKIPLALQCQGSPFGYSSR